MQLNEFEYQMLDALLEAFGSGDQLTRQQVLALFGDDEAFAADMARVLISEGLVAVSGKSGDQQLPSKLIRQAKAQIFLESGGFSNPRQVPPETQKPVWDAEHLQKRNTELQYETLRLQKALREKDTELQVLSPKAKKADQYRLALYAALAVIGLLLICSMWQALHHHR